MNAKNEKGSSQMLDEWNLLGIYVYQRDESLLRVPSTKLYSAPSARLKMCVEYQTTTCILDNK